MQDTNKDHVGNPNPVTGAQPPESSAPSPSFNVFRFRKISDDSQEFYDPVTDIMNILPGAIQSTMETLDGILQDTDQYPEACAMAANIHQLFQIRLIEQKDRVDDVLSDFIAVYKKTPMWLRTMFTETLFINLMTMWSVAQRRISDKAKKPLVVPEDEMRIGSIMSYLRPDTKSRVLVELMSSHRDAIHSIHTKASDETIYFTDDHGKVVLDDAKKFVASLVPIKDGPRSWDSVSKALGELDTDDVRIEAAKATYPGYADE